MAPIEGNTVNEINNLNFTDSENTYAVFGTTPLSSYEYTPITKEAVENVGRSEEKDVFYEAVIQHRFDKNLFIISKKEEREIIVLPQKPSTPPVAKNYPAPSALKLNGVPAASQILRVSGWYVDIDSKNTTADWTSGGQVVSKGPLFYVVNEADQDKEIEVRVRYSGPQAEAPESFATASVFVPAPRAAAIPASTEPVSFVGFQLEGGAVHTDPIKGVATYSDGQEHEGFFQWYRSDSGNVYALNNFTTPTYSPTADDLLEGVSLICKYTVGEGKDLGKVYEATASASYLTINPAVANAYNAKIREKKPEFNVIDSDGNAVILSVNKKRVKITNPTTKNIVRVKLSAFLVVFLFRSEEDKFRVQLNETTAYRDFKAANRNERDVIALTIRYFTGAKKRFSN